MSNTQTAELTLRQRIKDVLDTSGEGRAWGSQPGAYQIGASMGIEVNRIIDELTTLEARADRLEARLERLEQDDA